MGKLDKELVVYGAIVFISITALAVWALLSA